MQVGDFLFVYGTLRKGEGADLAKNLQVFYIGEDTINGKMYNIGWFPGLKDTSDIFEPDLSLISGDVFMLKTKTIGAILDAYEGYPSLYSRTKVETLSGKTAWVYTFNGDVSGKRFIESGDWRRRNEVPVELDSLTKLALSLN